MKHTACHGRWQGTWAEPPQHVLQAAANLLCIFTALLLFATTARHTLVCCWVLRTVVKARLHYVCAHTIPAPHLCTTECPDDGKHGPWCCLHLTCCAPIFVMCRGTCPIHGWKEWQAHVGADVFLQ
ncbi:hypothetical protein COO60DRAFT_1485858 [Scenedesmus sp. NREL 46B-D3]|nr:hypothetical protein COO60DRAFT_1485858 [Scenedesmus sp. NREL 46B-D3]